MEVSGGLKDASATRNNDRNAMLDRPLSVHVVAVIVRAYLFCKSLPVRKCACARSRNSTHTTNDRQRGSGECYWWLFISIGR